MAYIDSGNYSGPLPDPNTTLVFDGASWNNISIDDINDIMGITSGNGTIKLRKGAEEIELTFQEIKRIKELLMEKFPEDYI